MQVSNNTDPAITSAAIQIQIDSAVATKARQVQQQQGDAMVQLIEDVVEVTEQLASGHIDVKL